MWNNHPDNQYGGNELQSTSSSIATDDGRWATHRLDSAFEESLVTLKLHAQPFSQQNPEFAVGSGFLASDPSMLSVPLSPEPIMPYSHIRLMSGVGLNWA